MKIIGIGLEKTGLTSLKTALIELGYDFCEQKDEYFKNKYQLLPDVIISKLIKRREFKDFYELIDSYDAFSDVPWPLLYKEIDKKYPGCKFILTERDQQAWLRSMVKYFGNMHSWMREMIYGAGEPMGHEEAYLLAYQHYVKEVKEYFKARSQDLLIVNWEKGDGWKELCTFLQKPQPQTKFPHENQYQNHQGKAKTFVAGSLLLPKDSANDLDKLYFQFKHAAGTRFSFLTFPDLKDTDQNALGRFFSGLESRKHINFIKKHMANFDAYCSVLPIPYKKIDKLNPGSKFILLQASDLCLQDTFLGKLKEYVPFLPNVFLQGFAAYLRAYERKMKDFFRARASDFIVLQVGEENKDKLLEFYGL